MTTSPSSPNLHDDIERWLAVDPDPATRAELAQLAADEPQRAARLFNGRIAFGTAGLRAGLGPGPKMMNRVVVTQTSAGLARWLRDQDQEGIEGRPVVIGFDARHNSEVFAQDVAREMAAAGFTAELLVGPTPTPVLAYAVLDRQAAAGIMITASHNPPQDNGYKLYLSDGIQLVSPADAEIAAAIDQVAAQHQAVAEDELTALQDDGADDQERRRRFQGLRDSSLARLLGSEGSGGSVIKLDDRPQLRHRQAAVAALLTEARDVNVLYSAMHGVGGRHLLDCFADAGFPPPAIVAEQFDPDPDFPTAAFPNPEEPGALDLAYAQASASSSGLDSDLPSGPDSGPSSGLDSSPDIILANDPDADRLAVAVPDRDGQWRRLTGDQVGFLFLDHLFRHRSGVPNPLVASSIVSSRFINRLAEASGATSIRTLTGFKWVARPTVDQPEATFLMGYEEALGYCIGDRVRDKDGVSAALVMAEIAAGLKAQGLTLWDRLDALAAEHGLYATTQVTVSFAGLSETEQQELKSRATAASPSSLAGVEVVGVENLAEGRTLPPTPGVVIDLADQSRIIVRPSGTEPKMKAYIEVIETVDGEVADARERAQQRMSELAEAVHRLLTAFDG